MGRRSVRITLFVFALLATAGLGYRAVTDERDLTLARQDGARLDQAAEEALSALLDLRGSMHAYVAPNQGTDFWGQRVGMLFDTLKQRLVALDMAAAASWGSLAQSLDGLDQLTAADKRARQYADRGEMLLAGDVLFAEVRDLLKAVTEEVGAVRNAHRGQADRQVAGFRQEQAVLAMAGVAVWLLVALMLLPTAGSVAVKDPVEWRHELASTLKKPKAEGPTLDLKKIEAVESLAPVAPVPDLPDLKVVAEICADLSALTDIGALSGALARASDVLGAKGLIVWVTSNDGAMLSPVSTHGFDARVVKRFRAIDRAGANLTAEALRANAPRSCAAHGSTAAAIAVPMSGPSGVVGVLSAELQPGKAASAERVAVAAILAAQLATLTVPLPIAGVGEVAGANSAAS